MSLCEENKFEFSRRTELKTFQKEKKKKSEVSVGVEKKKLVIVQYTLPVINSTSAKVHNTFI